MKRILPLLLALTLLPAAAFAQKASELKWTDAKDLMLINQGYDNTELTYSRLPVDMKPVTRKAVWELGLNSAGLAIRFSTDSRSIGIRWTLLNYFIMHHMAGTGIRGIDLYQLDENDHWQFVGTAIPNGKDTTKTQIVVSGMDGKDHDYMAYLPLYDGVTKVEIGVTKDAKVGQPHRDVLVKGQGKPIVFYGTSITQGGCASRPGMVYTSIISRALQKECVNLGFSGNARMDKALAEMGRLYLSIKDPEVRGKINEIMRITDKIVQDAINDPSDIPQIKKFMNYYLPTTIKLLNAYDRMSSQGIEGENLDRSMKSINEMLDQAIVAYKKRLDSLFENQALDIETDIEVMNTMLAREGLSGTKDFEI